METMMDPIPRKGSKLKKTKQQGSEHKSNRQKQPLKPTCENLVATNKNDLSLQNKNCSSIDVAAGGGVPMKKRKKYEIARFEQELKKNSRKGESPTAKTMVSRVKQNNKSKDVEDKRGNDTLKGNSNKEGVKKKMAEVADDAFAKSMCKVDIKEANDKRGSDNIPAKKRKKDSFQDAVLRHMYLSGKPFSLKGLAKETRTTGDALKHLLLSLLDKGYVVKKSFGKSGKELYWANIDDKKGHKEMKNFFFEEEDMQTAGKELSEFLSRKNKILNELETLIKMPTNDEVDSKVRDLLEENSLLQKRSLAAIAEKERAAQQRKLKTPAELKQMDRERCPRRKKIRINALRDEWKKRKEKCMDFVDQLADAMDKNLKDVIKLLDVETDKSVGIDKMPPKHSI